MKSIKEVLNKKHFRELFAGEEFNIYFPKSNCNRVIVENGFIDKAFWPIRYRNETKNIAKILNRPTISEAIKNIESFLYSHIQYKTASPHFVKSPACLWHTRNEGANCMSFTIFASSILFNLKINHYIKSVSYENGLSHVYVVVPLNQKNSRLNETSQYSKDYLIIDGSGKYHTETPYIKLKYNKYVNPSNYIFQKNIITFLGIASVLYISNKAIKK